MKHDLITIGITCFNAKNTIARAVESALAQNWENKEILVVDDASSDGSEDIIESLTASHPVVRLIRHNTNKGVAAARNTLLNEAKGEFLAFFDDDDESDPTRIEKQYQRIISYECESGETLIACYASGVRLYPNGHEFPFKAIGCTPPIPNGPRMADRILFFGGDDAWNYGSGGTPTCSLMARLSTFNTVGGFDADFRRNEDTELAVRLALAGGHFIGCEEELVKQHATFSGDKTSEHIYDAHLKKAEKHKTYLQSKNRYYYAKYWPLMRHPYFNREFFRMLWVLLKLWAHYPLQVPKHFLKTGPARLFHDMNIKKRQNV